MKTELVIDDRRTESLDSVLGSKWRLVTDGVMGGVSQGNLSADFYRNKKCLRLHGDVSTRNNGGFIQMALDLSDDDCFDASSYSGVEIEVAGNDERYNLHLRTLDLEHPWQSYRAGFHAATQWETIKIPFSSLEPYRTSKGFDGSRLRRIGLLGIGRDFEADLYLALIRLYSD